MFVMDGCGSGCECGYVEVHLFVYLGVCTTDRHRHVATPTYQHHTWTPPTHPHPHSTCAHHFTNNVQRPRNQTTMMSVTKSTQVKGVLHPWALFWKTLCIFSKNKATSEKVSSGSGQKFPKELKNYSFTSVQTIVVKLQWKMCENQYFPCFEP